MRFRYSTTNFQQNEFDSLPRIPLILDHETRSVEVVGLVDSGATINVLPRSIGIQLGFIWETQKAIIQLSGNLSERSAIPIFVMARVGEFNPVRLAFAWIENESAPLILGQTNFFLEFDVCFYRPLLEFEISPKVYRE